MTPASPVIILGWGLSGPRPIFHFVGAGNYTDADGYRTTEHRTRCRIVYYRLRWQPDARPLPRTSPSIDSATYIRLDHAEKIGRLCLRCRRAGPRP